MLDSTFWFILPINPEPWSVGPVAYNGKTKKPFMGRNQQLDAYKQAVREQIEIKYPTVKPLEGPIELGLWFWRQRAEYQNKLNNRKTTKNKVDTTNMQKATEDALQGVLYPNDKEVRKVYSETVSQGADIEPRIIIMLKSYTGLDMTVIPEDVWAVYNQLDTLDFINTDQRW